MTDKNNPRWLYKDLPWKVDLFKVLKPQFSSEKKLRRQLCRYRLILTYLGHNANGTGLAWPEQRNIAAHAYIGHTIVSNYLKVLRLAGLLDWKTRKGNQHKKGYNVYQLNLAALKAAPKVEYKSDPEAPALVPETYSARSPNASLVPEMGSLAPIAGTEPRNTEPRNIRTKEITEPDAGSYIGNQQNSPQSAVDKNNKPTYIETLAISSLTPQPAEIVCAPVPVSPHSVPADASLKPAERPDGPFQPNGADRSSMPQKSDSRNVTPSPQNLPASPLPHGDREIAALKAAFDAAELPEGKRAAHQRWKEALEDNWREAQDGSAERLAAREAYISCSKASHGAPWRPLAA